MTNQVQIEFLRAYKELFNPDWRYLVYYGGRSGGKSWSVAMALILRAREQKVRVLCTRELQNSIRDSVHKLLADLIGKYEFNDFLIQKDSITNTVTGSEFIFRGLKNNVVEIKSMEGIDIAWCEESQTLTKESIDILTPTIRKKGSQIIFTFNRFTELDPVFVKFVLQKPDKTHAKKVNYGVLESAGLLPDVIKEEIEEDRKNQELFAHKWLGEPLSQGEYSVIPRGEILNSMNRNIEDDGQIFIGVDVARMGSDRTVLWKRKGLKSVDFKVYEHKRTTEVCDLLEAFADSDRQVDIRVDDTGVGGGVTDEMKKRGYNISAINFGARPHNINKYPNLISEAWFELADLITEVQLPMNNDLLMELSTRQWTQDSKGKRRIESKQEYKKRGFRSPDLADACILAYYSGKKKIRTFDKKPSLF